MDNEYGQGQESVYTNKVRAGRRRTYFFDVRKTKGEDFYVTLTESTKRFQGEGYNRHKLFLYKEDFNRFLEGLQETIDHVKAELMPDYDYEQFDRRQEEWEKQKLEEEGNSTYADSTDDTKVMSIAAETPPEGQAPTTKPTPKESDPNVDIEEDMSW